MPKHYKNGKKKNNGKKAMIMRRHPKKPKKTGFSKFTKLLAIALSGLGIGVAAFGLSRAARERLYRIWRERRASAHRDFREAVTKMSNDPERAKRLAKTMFQHLPHERRNKFTGRLEDVDLS